MKFDGFELYKRDDELESVEGVDLRFPNGVTFTVLRAGGANRKFARTFSRLTKPYQRQMDAGSLDDATESMLYAKLYAESVIIGWSGVTSEGAPVEATTKNIVEFLLAWPEVFAEIRSRSESIATFRRDEIKEDVEKLGND